jgi:hypothetical protein
MIKKVAKKSTTEKPSYADLVVAIRTMKERVSVLEAHIGGGPSTSAMPVSQGREAYCVIGDKSSCNRALMRTWKKTEQDAVAHAAGLLDQLARGYNDNTTKLFVVKVVAVVHKKQPVTQVDVRPLDSTTRMELFSNR